MADWNQPSLSDSYSDFQTRLKNRDLDAMTLMNVDGTNIPENAIKYLRASNKFQERISGAWVDKLLAIAGGGTGAATAADARTNLGLGTIATQAANNVTITGGSISGVSSLGTNGDLTVGGVIKAGSGVVQLTTAGGKIQAISSTYFNDLSGANLINLNASNISSGNLAVARMPLSGAWAITAALSVTGHSFLPNGFGFGAASKSATFTAAVDETFIYVDSSGANRTANLPAAVTGKVYVIYKNATANLVTIDPNGTELVRVGDTNYSTYDLQTLGESLTLIGIAGFGWLAFGGGMNQIADIFHGDVSFGSGETTKTSTITWEGGDPASIDEIDLEFHGPYLTGDATVNHLLYTVHARITSTTQVTFDKIQISGGATSPAASTHYFTVKKYRGVA